MRIDLAKTFLIFLGGAAICSSGCVALTAPANFVKSFQKPKVERVSYEEEVIELPDKLRDPEGLKVAYARWMEDMQQYGEARAKYQEVLDSEPKNVVAILGLARIDQQLGLHSEAEQKYRKAVRFAPDSAAVQNAFGKFYVAQANWEAALEPLTEAMLASPEDVNYRFELAVALVHVGDIDSALPHFIRTVGDAEAHFNVAMILKEIGDYNAAEKHLMLAVTKKPEFKQAHYWLAHLREERNDGIAIEPTPQYGTISSKQQSNTRPSHSFSSTGSAATSAQQAAAVRELAATAP
ncbi:cellulose synthase subunit BcsC [Thalassoglobus neptunius]|uniref:Cellulose synthase subunit BcsC n=1 Tax=Thalassoglobus neptunius TaxID=1938619 RepID=A0A5C5VWB9_9PLAN|nr:tetratricopeptide repeat protein [Thalassoglobus neptunius]TWT42976.1 cellulose synthase subunit BcsC [Thalassoglobus neptunius]